MERKSEMISKIQNFSAMVMNQYNTKIKRFRSDNGGEYNNRALKNFFQNEGIIYKNTALYSYESNGKAERYNRTIVIDA